MDGPSHYREAERLLRLAEKTPSRDRARTDAALAQAHATLALAAATVDGAIVARSSWTDRDGLNWTGAECPDRWREALS